MAKKAGKRALRSGGSNLGLPRLSLVQAVETRKTVFHGAWHGAPGALDAEILATRALTSAQKVPIPPPPEPEPVPVPESALPERDDDTDYEFAEPAPEVEMVLMRVSKSAPDCEAAYDHWLERQEYEVVLLRSPEPVAMAVSVQTPVAEASKVQTQVSALEEFTLYADDVESGTTGLVINLAVGPLLNALCKDDIDTALELFHTRHDHVVGMATQLERQERELTELRSRPVRVAPPAPPSAPIPVDVDRVVATSLENRVRELVHALRHDALDLPGRFRTAREAFGRERSAYYLEKSNWDKEVTRVLDRERLPVELDLAENNLASRASHLVPVELIERISRLLERAGEVGQRVSELEVNMTRHIEACHEQREVCRDTREQLNELSGRGERIREACRLLRIDLPPELDQALRVIQDHALANTDAERVPDTLQLRVPPRPEVLRVFLESLTGRRADLWPYLCRSPQDLFHDRALIASDDQALAALILVAFDMHTTQDKGRSAKSIVAWIGRSGLVSTDHGLDYEPTLDVLEDFVVERRLMPRPGRLMRRTLTERFSQCFRIERYKIGYTWNPTETCRSLAQRLRRQLVDEKLVAALLHKGKTAYRSEMREAHAAGDPATVDED